MANPSGAVSITNLSAFRRDLQAAEDASPRELTKGLKVAGGIVVAEAKVIAPRVTGTLEAGYKASVRASTGNIVNSVPYAAGAEWGTHGKWSGFLKYGGPGRFAWKSIEIRQNEIVEAIAIALEDIVALHGWAT